MSGLVLSIDPGGARSTVTYEVGVFATVLPANKINVWVGSDYFDLPIDFANAPVEVHNSILKLVNYARENEYPTNVGSPDRIYHMTGVESAISEDAASFVEDTDLALVITAYTGGDMEVGSTIIDTSVTRIMNAGSSGDGTDLT